MGEPLAQRRMARKRALTFIALSVFPLVVAVYLIGAAFFTTHFVPGLTVNGIDASMLTEGELAQKFEDQANQYEQVVTKGDFAMLIKGSDIGLTYDGAEFARNARVAVSALTWPFDILASRDVEVDGSVTIDDEELLKAASNGAAQEFDSRESSIAPTDAAPVLDEETHTYIITPESVGTMVAGDSVYEQTKEAFLDRKPRVALTDDALSQPAIRADNEALVAAVDKANSMLAMDIPLTSDGNELTHIGYDQLSQWINISDSFDVSLNHDAIYTWSEEGLTDQVNRTDEEHVWGLDAESCTNDIVSAVQNGSNSPVEVPLVALVTKPAATPGARDRGRHIDVNLSTQFARLYDYDGTVIWDSYFVSGCVNEGHSTPEGEFAIEAKAQGVTLTGADYNHDGESDYESYVNYWMPFLAGDWGLHDATWRGDYEFGGDTYIWNGSHGCVNLPYYTAEQLYYLVDVGDPVVVHY